MIDPREHHGDALRTILRAGHGWLFLHKGVFLFAEAKNCENQREYHDIIDAMVEMRGQKVNTSKRTPLGWLMSYLNGRGRLVGLTQECLTVCNGKVESCV